MNTESARRLLELAKDTGALLEGEFTLASGKRSTHYFDGKKLGLWPEAASLIGRIVFDQLKGAGVESVGGLAMGAFPIAIATALVSHQEGHPIPAFIVRPEPKEHGTRRKIEGHCTPGSRVAIVDDVVTTGESIDRAIKAVEAEGCRVVKVLVLVDRHEGGSDLLRQQGYDVTRIIDLWPTGEATIAHDSASAGEDREGAVRR